MVNYSQVHQLFFIGVYSLQVFRVKVNRLELILQIFKRN